MSNPSISMTRFKELHWAHQRSLAEYMPEKAKKNHLATIRAEEIYEENHGSGKSDKWKEEPWIKKAFARGELHLLNEKVDTVDDVTEMTAIMKRVKELEEVLKS